MYYYTVASLPYLQLDGEILVSVEEFRQLCRERLSASDMALLESTKLVPEAADLDGSRRLTPVQQAYYSFEAQLRNELATVRAAKLGWDPEESLRPQANGGASDAELAERAREAFQNDSPYEAERQLDRARWLRLDELEVLHYFDIEKLIVYYLKLQILDRRVHMNAAEGAEVFEEVYDRAALKIEAQNMPL